MTPVLYTHTLPSPARRAVCEALVCVALLGVLAIWPALALFACLYH